MTMVSLFDDIDRQEMDQLLTCLSGRWESYKEGEIILMAGEKADRVGMVRFGSVLVLSDDFWGNRTILACVETGGLFGEAFSFGRVERLPVSVMASELTEVLFLDCERIVSLCPSDCAFHGRLIRNMLRILAEKNMGLVQKISHISKRNTKEKILSYLSEQAKRAGKASFTIPLDRQGMADFLAVDRSALSKELGRLRDEGRISFHKNRFRLGGVEMDGIFGRGDGKKEME